jgi:hypothetical protein
MPRQENFESPRKYETAFLALMASHTDGTVSLPTPQQVDAALVPRDISGVRETEQVALDRVIGEFVSVAESTERRSATAMTAAGFAIAIAGLLLHTGSRVSPIAAAVMGAIAFGGFVAGMVGQAFSVGKPPAQKLSTTSAQNALTHTVHKEFYAQWAMILATLALGGELVTFVVSVL